jgi:hypothetical protein
MLTRDAAEMVAHVTGRKILPAVRVIDRILAAAGFTKSARRQMISEAFGRSESVSRNHERTAP